MHNPKKIYFIDQALAVNVGFRFSDDPGRLLENIVFIELKRRGFEIYYHQGKKECDFLLREGGKITGAIQVCTNLNNDSTYEREIAGLVEALEMYNLPTGLIITQDQQRKEKITVNQKTVEIDILPVWRWLLD